MFSAVFSWAGTCPVDGSLASQTMQKAVADIRLQRTAELATFCQRHRRLNEFANIMQGQNRLKFSAWNVELQIKELRRRSGGDADQLQALLKELQETKELEELQASYGEQYLFLQQELRAHINLQPGVLRSEYGGDGLSNMWTEYNVFKNRGAPSAMPIRMTMTEEKDPAKFEVDFCGANGRSTAIRCE